MKKIIATLMSLAGATRASTDSDVTYVDPNEILASIPTISEDVAAVDPLAGSPGADELTFHEDDWAQVEFFAKDRVAEIQRVLSELSVFERANRLKTGWKKLYVRKIERKPVIASAEGVAHLERVLGVKAGGAPVLTTSSAIVGRVRNGFSLSLGGNVALYGYVDGVNVPVLGASVGANPDDAKLTEAFAKLHASDQLILVDWRAQMVLLSVGADGKIGVWRR